MYFSIPAKGNGYWMWENFNPIAIYAILNLFLFEKKYKNWKALFIILAVFSLVPAAAFVFSGFSTISNRWCYAFAFVTSFCAVLGLKNICSLTNKALVALALPIVFFGALIIGKDYINTNVLIGYIFIILVYLVILFINTLGLKKASTGLIIISFLIISSMSYGILKFSPEYSTRLKQNVDRGQAIKKIKKSPLASFYKKIDDTDFYRIDDVDKERNNFSSSLLMGYNGISSYSNIMPAVLMDFIETMGLSSAQTCKVIFAGVDDRFILNSLLGVKYLCGDNNTVKRLPYNYKISGVNSRDQFLAVNDLVLPLGYAYDSYMIEEDFRKLSILDKQELMTDTIVLDKKTDERVPRTSDIDGYDNVDIPVRFTQFSELDYKNNRITVSKSNASLYLDFRSIENSELYIYIKGFEPVNERDTSIITISVPEYGATATVRGKGNTYQRNQENMLIHLGYFVDPVEGATLKFSTKGSFRVEEISVLCQPMKGKVTENLNRLQEPCLKDVQRSNDCIKGCISLEKPKVLCLSIPYDKGWTAKVNGIDYPVLKGNIMFTAIALPEGEHEIELHYSIPGFKAGAIITGISVCCYLGILAKPLFRRKITKNK